MHKLLWSMNIEITHTHTQRERMSQEQRTGSRMKVVMLPWLAYGHINAFLELAKKLTKRNLQIYLCSTPINLTSIKERIKDEDSITLVEFHLESTTELPPHYHTTTGLPPHLVKTLIAAQASAGPDFMSNIIKTLAPDLLIYDYFQGWAATTASSYNIPAVMFLSVGAAMLLPGLHTHLQPDTEFPFPAIQLQGYHAKRRCEKTHNVADIDVLEKSGEILLLNTFRGLEGKFLDYLPTLIKIKVVPVGPIVQDAAMDDAEEDLEIMRWLGEKKESSTVFVSCGSGGFISKQETEEMALGLELSEVNFIWVVRLPQDEIGVSNIEEALPDGFLERVRGGDRGLVIKGWAPQAKILAHPNTGGFVSHCGWNSILESLKAGVPIIAVPRQYDQPLNARILEDIGAGVEVKRDDDGRIDREDIAQAIRKVVVDENGEEIRTKAKDLRAIMELEGESQIDGLVQELTKLVSH